MKTWPEKISVIESNGWSLKKIAEHVDMSQGALSDVKSGRSKEPTGMSAVQLHALYIIESKKSARQPQKAAA